MIAVLIGPELEFRWTRKPRPDRSAAAPPPPGPSDRSCGEALGGRAARAATALVYPNVYPQLGSIEVLNLQAPPPPFRESVRLAERNLHARARDLVGDRNRREHEFVVQLRSFDAAKSGADLGVAVLIALSSALLGRSLKGGFTIVGGLNLSGSVEPGHNPVEVMELAMEKGADMVLLPVSCRRALVDLSDDVASARAILVLSRRSISTPPTPYERR
jgi:Lon protease (S16) C-terminal proteolytic domain